MNDRFAELMADVKGRKTTEDLAEHADARTGAGDTCLDAECDREMYELRHPRSGDSGIPRHKDAPEVEVCCVTHGIQVQR